MKVLIIFIFIFEFAYAGVFSVNKVIVNCIDQQPCEDTQKVFSSLSRTYSSEDHFYNVFKLYVSNEGVKELSFKIKIEDSFKNLYIEVKKKPRILRVLDTRFKGKYEIELPSVISIQKDDFLDRNKVSDTKNLYKDIAKEKGFPDVNVIEKISKGIDGVLVGFEVELNDPVVISKVTLNSKSNYIRDFVSKRFLANINKPFDIQNLKTEIEDVKILLQSFGYYLIDFDLKYQFLAKKSVSLFIEVKNVKRHVFYIKQTEFLDPQILKDLLAENITSGKREFSIENIEQILLEKYETLGFKFPKFIVKKSIRLDSNDDPITHYDIAINEGIRSKVEEIVFKGNGFFTQEELLEHFNLLAPEQTEFNFYTPEYYNNFTSILREKYIKAGFVSVFIDNPVLQFNQKTKKVTAVFRIREGIKTTVAGITIIGAARNDLPELLNLIQTKENDAFNPVQFKEDLSKVTQYLKNQGYYFSRIVNLASPNLVKYITDNSQVKIEIEIETGKKLYADDIIIIGNKATRKILIKRELNFKSGSLITSGVLETSQAQLLSLGLFSSVQIKPVSQNTEKTDVLIFVREKDFGLIEFAPGVRSDIGFKLSTTITYNNIDGMNKRISFQGTVNRRFDLNSLDDTRRQSSKVLLEYNTAVNYSENHIFHSDYDFSMSVSKSRKRFYSYDADIERLGYSVSRKFWKWLSLSVRQQIERISQFESTEEINHGHYQIGSITPSVSFDFRNRPVNPTSGALFDISYEFANPSVFSQEEDDLTIDYYKLISRNRIYIPVSDRIVLATSFAFGIQENKATSLNNDGSTVGYIPNIKVFRLSGADIVRGFEDEEINRLITGEDISKVDITKRAYMANIKIEPRYHITDTTIVGVFYDAGRVFVDEFSKDDLRSSAGITFKYVTPVGTLDFDYGIKLLRKEDSSGTLESPGRLHVSIGFF
ncbi:MAG: outer membrane protein insertion porin family [Bacteriovoracaceae bacterium]|jgi:outer membrane protein insertion porin family